MSIVPFKKIKNFIRSFSSSFFTIFVSFQYILKKKEKKDSNRNRQMSFLVPGRGGVSERFA